MISQRSTGLTSLLALGQIAVCSAMYWLLVAAFVTFSEGGLLSSDRYVLYWLLMHGALLIEALARRGRGSNPLRDRFVQLHGRTARQVFCAVLPLFIFLVAAKDRFISRSFLFAWLPLFYVTLAASGAVLPRLLAGWLYGGKRRERTLLVGPPAEAERLRDWLAGKAFLGLEVVGGAGEGVPPPPPTPAARPHDTVFEELPSQRRFPVLGPADDLERLIAEHGVTQVLRTGMPPDDASAEGHLRMMDVCERLGVRFLVVDDLERRWGRPISFVEDDGLRLLGLREEPLENPLNLALKRAIDVAFSLPVLVLALPPVALVTWIVQRLQSPGPLFHWQRRAGLQNREFFIMKLRTMHADHGQEARQARVGDERVYPLGRFLRKWSLDELPQFWNVLRGEMSLVGPRPHLIEHNSQFARQLAQYHVRTFVKPGITGLAQVRGFRGEARDSADIANRVLSDIEYLENWRLSLEFAIIVRTAAQLIRPPKSAY